MRPGFSIGKILEGDASLGIALLAYAYYTLHDISDLLWEFELLFDVASFF